MKLCKKASSDSVLSDNLYIELFEKKIRSNNQKKKVPKCCCDEPEKSESICSDSDKDLDETEVKGKSRACSPRKVEKNYCFNEEPIRSYQDKCRSADRKKSPSKKCESLKDASVQCKEDCDKNCNDILYKNLTEETSCKDHQIFNEIIRNEKIKFINYCRMMKANYMKRYSEKSKERDLICECQFCNARPEKKSSQLNCLPPPPPPLPCGCRDCCSPPRVPTCYNLKPKQKQSCSTCCACYSPRKSVTFSPRCDFQTSCKCVQTVDMNPTDYQCSCMECSKKRQGYDDDSEYYDYNLPYQNNDDYMDLIEELEEKLVCRNRNRVRKTMLEFENRSKLNKPLEKPILNHDEISESDEPILENLCEFKKRKQKTKRSPKRTKKITCQCNSDRGDWNEENNNNYTQTTPRQTEQNCYCVPRYSKSPKNKPKAKWKKNQKGEWCRVDKTEDKTSPCTCKNCCQQKNVTYDYSSCE